jgi:hypothetical protein
MELKLYDTLTRQKRLFEPLDRARVRVYVCGPRPFPRHWLYYIVLKYALIAVALVIAFYVAYQFL